ncbi:MAG: protein kinase [Anaerolineae bacterium]|nr:protein kinase [Anaerolineae bacterium]
MIGETIGKYKIVEHLGSGGMAEVYKAHHPGLDRYVAIKVLHSFLATEQDFLTRFKREAKAVAALRHPNIVQVYDFDLDKERDIYYMVMEFLEGTTLKVRLQELDQKGERMSLEEAVRITEAVGEALAYAHQRGMVHRDVKPANIMLTVDGDPILTDFGIAKMVSVSGLTASGAMMGTPAYISPEQGLGRTSDERSDIYSLGVVFYQLVTGILPFDADTPMGIVMKHISDPLPMPTAVVPDLPLGLERVIARVLAKSPDQRYQTVADFLADIRRAVAGQDITPPPAELTVVSTSLQETISAPLPGFISPETPPPAGPPAASPRRRIPWLPILLGGAALMAVIVLGVLALGVGQFGFFLTDATPSPPLVSSPAPDLAATRLAALEATISAPTPTGTASPDPTATLTPTPVPDLTATALAQCVYSMEITDDVGVWPSPLAPGRSFTKRWTVKNNGTCPWPDDCQLVFVSGEQMGGPDAMAVPPLQVDEEWEIQLDLAAPGADGTYSGVWQVQDAAGNALGDDLEVAVRVGPTPTPLPPTPTPTPEFTPTPQEPLGMSVPAFSGPCVIDVWAGTWGGTLAWSVWGGTGQFYYFVGGVGADAALPGPAWEFTTQTGRSILVKFFTTSAPASLLAPLPEGCCEGVEGRWVSPEGYEVVWRSVNYNQSNCP